MHFYQNIGKRCFDLTVGFSAIVLVAPLIILIAIIVRYKLGSPVLFTQIRPGKNGRPFHLYKFRTMTSERDRTGQLLPDADRLTPFGTWLRSTSLDELPELWNIIRGDMSLVGPRPLLMEYLSLYSIEQARRHHVRPGLTGWAQVQARNATTWAERFHQDCWYVDNISLRLDIDILWRTIVAVVMRRGIAAADHATMPRFDEISTPGEAYDQAA